MAWAIFIFVCISSSGQQLDVDDGCFCSSYNLIDDQLKAFGRNFYIEKSNGLYKYFENVEYIVGTCLFGIMKSDFKDGTMEYGVKQVSTKDVIVPVKYFNNFINSNDSSLKTIIIFDLFKFYNLIINRLVHMGAKKEEIMVSSVYYVNKQMPFFVNNNFPFEYFLKDSQFADQSELRILVVSKNKSFYQRLKKHNNNINIGNISSFANIQNKYKSDLCFSIQENKLLYSLSSPKYETLEQRSFCEIVIELYQILQNHLPGKAKQQSELNELAKPLIDFLKAKYGVTYKDDWRLYNVSYKDYLSLPDLYKGMCESIVMEDV